jgi:zinc D-Ala-D-Ala carboxypeptidase
MLQALLEITQGRRVRVSEIAGASHSANSLHYQGTAFDIDLISGVSGPGNTISHQLADPLVSICKAQGAREAWLETAAGTPASSSGNGNHVHCGWSSSVA